jgi:hypothetical protein
MLVSERLTGALLNRFTHRGHILEDNGESYCLKDVKHGRDIENSAFQKSTRIPWGAVSEKAMQRIRRENSKSI